MKQQAQRKVSDGGPSGNVNPHENRSAGGVGNFRNYTPMGSQINVNQNNMGRKHDLLREHIHNEAA